jgi:hypothetical protein
MFGFFNRWNIHFRWFVTPSSLSDDWISALKLDGFNLNPNHWSVRKAARISKLPWALIKEQGQTVGVGSLTVSPNTARIHGLSGTGTYLRIDYRPKSQQLADRVEIALVKRGAQDDKRD